MLSSKREGEVKLVVLLLLLFVLVLWKHDTVIDGNDMLEISTDSGKSWKGYSKAQGITNMGRGYMENFVVVTNTGIFRVRR